MAGTRITGGTRDCADTGVLCIPVGPSLTIALSDGDRAASWLLEVDVELVGSGSFRLGGVITSPPAVIAPAARVVAVAFCPGAERWRVFAVRLAGAVRAVATLELSMSACCPAFVGLVPVYPHATPAFAEVISPPAVLVGAVGVPTVLVAPLVPMRSIVVQADPANTDPVWIGGSTVTPATGIELAAGEVESIDVERGAPFAIALAGGQIVRVQVVR